jgi:hypothetical protein
VMGFLSYGGARRGLRRRASGGALPRILDPPRLLAASSGGIVTLGLVLVSWLLPGTAPGAALVAPYLFN